MSGSKGNGFIGFRWLSARNVNIQNNLNITIGDFYSEQAKGEIFNFSGNSFSDKGNITIGGGQKIHSYNISNPATILVNNYKGNITLMQANFMKIKHNKELTDQIIIQDLNNTNNNLNFLLWGVGFTNYANNSKTTPYKISTKINLVQSTVVTDSSNNKYDIPEQNINNKSLLQMQQALKNLNYLSNLDIKMKE
jgi:hypothetical protein